MSQTLQENIHYVCADNYHLIYRIKNIDMNKYLEKFKRKILRLGN